MTQAVSEHAICTRRLVDSLQEEQLEVACPPQASRSEIAGELIDPATGAQHQREAYADRHNLGDVMTAVLEVAHEALPGPSATESLVPDHPVAGPLASSGQVSPGSLGSCLTPRRSTVINKCPPLDPQTTFGSCPASY